MTSPLVLACMACCKTYRSRIATTASGIDDGQQTKNNETTDRRRRFICAMQHASCNARSRGLRERAHHSCGGKMCADRSRIFCSIQNIKNETQNRCAHAYPIYIILYTDNKCMRGVTRVGRLVTK